MKPDQKYMSEVESNSSNYSFTPPSFNKNLFRNSPDKNNSYFSELYPSETEESELYCYHNSLGNCYSQNLESDIRNEAPTIIDALRNLNFDEDEILDLNQDENSEMRQKNPIQKIFSQIQNNNPEIYRTLLAYNIPKPIAKTLMKKIIRLTLVYSKNWR